MNRRSGRELDEEFAAHVELRAYHLTREGWEPEEAEREALRRFGDPRRVRRRVLRVLRPGWLRVTEGVLRVSLVGAGVGLLTAATTVVSGFQSRAPNTFVQPGPWVSIRGGDGAGVSPLTTYEEYRSLSARKDVLTRVTAARYETRMVGHGSAGDTPSRIKRVSTNYLEAIGAVPVLGRGFLPEEDGEPVAILTSSTWDDWYGQSDEVLDQTVLVGDVPHRIVGVLPESVAFYYESRLVVPLSTREEALQRRPRLLVSGMLRSHLTLDQATAALDWSQRSLQVVTAQQSYSEGYRGAAARWLWYASTLALLCLLGTARLRRAVRVRGVRDPEAGMERSMRLAGGAVGVVIGVVCAADLGGAIMGDTAVVFDFSPGWEVTGWAILAGSMAWLVSEGVLAVARSSGLAGR